MSERKLPTTEQVAGRAYELYLERGCEDGHDLEDWLAAETELIAFSEQPASGTLKARSAGAGVDATSPIARKTSGKDPADLPKK